MSEMHQSEAMREQSAVVDVATRRRQVSEVLEDPTLFPVSYLGWLKRYLEQSGMTLPQSSIIGEKPVVLALKREVAHLRERIEALEQQMSSRQGDRL
jgi:hypothetical protein